MQMTGQFHELVALPLEKLFLGCQPHSSGGMKQTPKNILYGHVCDVTGHPECPVHIPTPHQYMAWHWPMKIYEWSQMLSLDFQLVFLRSVSMCHKTPNQLMIGKVMAAKIFLSFKRLIGVTQHKHCTDNNAIINKDNGRRERIFF